MTVEELIRKSERILAKSAEIRRRNNIRDPQIRQQLADIDRGMQELWLTMRYGRNKS